ncbi:MAG: hypothetical protein GX489_07220 [Firmicutes bacterium]|nr:hypothetical protein [Bacillota bacterium]
MLLSIEPGQAHNQGSMKEVQATLAAASKNTHGPKRKRIRNLEQYIRNNWAGIQASNSGASLGTIEGQNRHILCARMKHRGCRLGEKGSDYMARLLTHEAEGTLESLAQKDSRIDSRLATVVAELSKEKE